MDDDMHGRVAELGETLKAAGLSLDTAESCTGGLAGHLLTNVSGSSDWYKGGVVAYSNILKERLLGVPASAVEEEGAVSESVVTFMAQGAAERLEADCAVAISGIAGPSGGTPDKPVGTVWIAWKTPSGVEARVSHFEGPRGEVKLKSAQAALEGLLKRLK
jgi:nicotinamide-nucleotide amidase